MSTSLSIAGMIFCVLMCLLIRCEPRVGHGHGADVRLDRAERIVFAGDARGGQGVEQGRFADVRQADDSCFHGPYFLLVETDGVTARDGKTSHFSAERCRGTGTYHLRLANTSPWSELPQTVIIEFRPPWPIVRSFLAPILTAL